jgi:hypothetical protein
MSPRSLRGAGAALLLTSVFVGVGPAAPGGAQTAPPVEGLHSLTEAFPAVAEPSPATPGRGRRIEAYVGPNAARLSKGRLLVSTRPLRAPGPDGRPRAFDLSLTEEAGEHTPVAAPFELDMADDHERGFTVGPDPERAVKVLPLSLAPDAGPATVTAGKLFFPGTRTDTDTMLMPAVDGLESFEHLRSAEAPTAFAYRLGLTPRHAARIEGGDLVVTYDGRPALRVLAPVAKDADGTEIPARLRLDGAVLTIEVDHRQAGVHYPVLLDPAWVSPYRGSTGWEAWEANRTPSAAHYAMSAGSAGLRVAPSGGFTYGSDASGTWTMTAPGTSRIASVSWYGVRHRNDAHRQTLRLGLYGPGFGQINDFFDVGETYEPEIFHSDAAERGKYAVMRMFTPPCTASESNCPRAIPTGNSTYGQVGAVDVELVDDDAPGASMGGLEDLDGRWSEPQGQRWVSVDGSDDGLGVAGVSLLDTEGAEVHASGAPCGRDAQGRPCPTRHSAGWWLDVGSLPSGEYEYAPRAVDAVGNEQVGGGRALRIDRDDPVVEVAGALHEPRWYRPDAVEQLDLTGDDAHSGLASLSLRAYDAQGREVFDACPQGGACLGLGDAGRAGALRRSRHRCARAHRRGHVDGAARSSAAGRAPRRRGPAGRSVGGRQGRRRGGAVR